MGEMPPANPGRPTGARPLLINVLAAMALLTMGRRRLGELTSSGAIPSYKVGRSRRYSPVELSYWIAAGCPTTPGAGQRVREGMTR